MTLNSTTVTAGDDALATDYNDLRKDMILQAGEYVTSGGSADAQTFTVDAQITAYVEGMVIPFKAGYTNTGAMTGNVNAIADKNIKLPTGADPAAGDVTAGKLYELRYDGTNLVLMTVTAKLKFGGTGADGALTITSGATNIDCANAQVVIKNYSSISITGTGQLTFTNPHSNGTIIILRSQGNVTLTSSTIPNIDARSMGAAGGAGGTPANTTVAGFAGSAGSQGSGLTSTNNGSGGAARGGAAGAAGAGVEYDITLHYYAKIMRVACGGGGGGGGTGGGTTGISGIYGNLGGAGGAGGGALVIECAGSVNFTSTLGISVKGGTGSNGGTGNSANYSGGGGGGGGGGGTCILLYNTLTSVSGTIDVAGGSAGTGGAGNNDTGGSGGGGGANQVAGSAGSVGGGSGQGAAGGAGGAGHSLVVLNTEFL